MDKTRLAPSINFRDWIKRYEEAANQYGELANLFRDFDYLDYPDDNNFWHWYSFVLHNFHGLKSVYAMFALRQIWGVYDMRVAAIDNEPFSVGSCIIAHFPEDIDTGVLELPYYAKVYINDIVEDGIEFVRTEENDTYSFVVPYDQCGSIDVAELANDHFAYESAWNELVSRQNNNE